MPVSTLFLGHTRMTSGFKYSFGLKQFLGGEIREENLELGFNVRSIHWDMSKKITII